MPAIDPIKHVVLLMLENHSFDQMIGSLQSVYPDVDGVDIESPTARFNLDAAGRKIYQAPTIEQQLEQDPMHEHTNTMAQLANGNVSVAGRFRDAAKLLEVNSRLFPNSASAALQLGLALERAGENELAITQYHKVLVMLPANETALQHLRTLMFVKKPR